MHLTELAEIVEAKIDVKYIHERRCYHACIRGAEVMSDPPGMLASEFGSGTTPDTAQRDYAKKIRGKRIAFGGLSGPRREFKIPKSLSF